MSLSLPLQLYDEYMARSETRAVMSGGNFMGVINVLMQLRKVRHTLALHAPYVGVILGESDGRQLGESDGLRERRLAL
jgi:hypothetical protein